MTNYHLKTSRVRLLGLSTAALIIGTLGMPAAALAQDTQPTAASDSDEDIVITARRRSEALSTTPIAVTAFGAEDLLERSIRTDSDLQLVTPGLTIRQTQGNNSLTYSIRGQSADTFSGSPSAVIAYLNEVPLTIGSASSFYDLESVQVLKGPQGTLFGRNTTGGAVLYTSAKPTDELDGTDPRALRQPGPARSRRHAQRAARPTTRAAARRLRRHRARRLHRQPVQRRRRSARSAARAAACR